MLHRDVKPTNVLMEGRSPVLIDFGLARVAEDPRLTQTGWLLGTPGYLAPEILYGDDASPASDVHAWAATVVFAATGRPPYGKGRRWRSWTASAAASTTCPASTSPLRGVLREAMSPDPLERPSAARAPSASSATPGSRPTSRPGAPAPSSRAVDDAVRRPRRCRRPRRTQVPSLVRGPRRRPRRRRPALGEAPVREATPYQQPVPAAGSPPTRRTHPSRPRSAEPSGAQRMLQLLGLGLLAGATVAYAPYLGTALVAAWCCCCAPPRSRRQRHGRRQLVRGRARWYDVPTTTVSTPGYAVLALFGAVALVAVASLVALALFSLGYLFDQPVAPTTVVAGLGFAAALWWGPGSGRVREMTRGLVSRTAGTEFGGWFVVGMSVLGSAVLLGLLFGGGPNWAPEVHAPWR